MEKLFKYLGIGALAIILFFMGIVAITSVNSADTEEVLEPYLAEVVPQIATWDQAVYKKLFSEEAFKSATPEQWELYLNKSSSALGTFIEMGKPELKGFKTMSSIGGPSITYATYFVPVTFDTGLAHFRIGLQASEDKVEISGVQILSDLMYQ